MRANTVTRVAILVLLCMGYAAADQDAKDKLVGQWERAAGSARITISFAPDDTVALGDRKGSYRIAGDDLTLTFDGNTQQFKVKVTEQKLVMTVPQLGTSLVWTRVRARRKVKTPPFAVHKAEDHKIGYPKGWRIMPIMNSGYLMTETPDDTGAGLLLGVAELKDDIRTRQDLARASVQMLKKSIPDLRVTKQGVHPEHDRVLRTELTFSQNENVPYSGVTWCLTRGGIGIWVLFYVPTARVDEFDADAMILATLEPAIGDDWTGKGEGKTTAVAGEGVIHLIRRLDSGETVLCSLKPGESEVKQAIAPARANLVAPAISADGDMLALPLDGTTKMILASWPDQKTTRWVAVPGGGQECHITHPTFSHDRKLVAVRVAGFTHFGTAHEHDIATGEYIRSHAAIGSEITLLAFDTTTQKPKVAYYTVGALGDAKQPLFPAYSPTDDILAFIVGGRLVFCVGSTGAKIKEIPLGQEQPIGNSGLAWSPDGKKIAWLQRKEVTGRNVDERVAHYYLTLLDLQQGTHRNVRLPEALRPYSSAGVAAAVCLDFSPDAHQVIFSAQPRDPDKSTIVEEFDALQDQAGAKPCDLYVLQLETGAVRRITRDGRSFDPVWKGR